MGSEAEKRLIHYYVEAYKKAADSVNGYNISSIDGSGICLEGVSESDGSVVISIPYEDGYKVYVDGKKTTVDSYRGCFLRIPVDAGEHVIEVKYITPGIILGLSISIIILGLFTICLVIDYKKCLPEEKVILGLLIMNFGAVIVTFNRIEHLKKTLNLYTQQSLIPKRIVVVDNHSDDGTVEYLHGWEEDILDSVNKEVIYLSENSGGSGGFYTGLKQMQDYDDIDWIWVADDDAYPSLDAFEKAKDFIDDHQNEIDGIAAVCGVCGFDGSYSNIQRFRYKKTFLGIQDMPVPNEWYSKGTFDIDMYSFVGTILKRENLLKAGLPRKDFFIYQDDLEHATRMSKTGRIVCTTTIQITHKDNNPSSNDATWRDYYASRNIVALYKEHFSKWSLFWRIVRRKVFAFLSFKPAKIKIVNVAIRDGLKGNMGIHPVYKPGWKAE